MAEAGILTPRHIIAQFENWAQDQSGLPVSDSGWFPAAIYEQFLASRATDILEVYLKESNHINKWTQQTIGCVGLEEVPTEECPCAPPSGCTWYRTTRPIPSILEDTLTVTSIGGNLEHVQHFTYKDWQTVKYVLHSRLPAERTRGYYCIRNNYIYVVQSSHLKAITLSAIFYDPVEVQRYPRCGETMSYCDPFLDFALYIDPAKYQKLLITAFQAIKGMQNGTGMDTSNNAQPPFGVETSRPY